MTTSTITALSNTILFTFVDQVNSQGMFERENTETGIILNTSVDDSAGQPRWANVKHVGPDCTVTPGQQILIPNLRWTNHIEVDGKKMWKTDQTQIAAYRNTNEPNVVYPLASYVLFTPDEVSIQSSFGMLVVLSDPSDTPSGKITAVGPKADASLEVGHTLYYNGMNFTDTVTIAGKKVSFIKSDEVLAYA